MSKELMLNASNVASVQQQDLPIGLGCKSVVVVEVASYQNGVMVGMTVRGE